MNCPRCGEVCGCHSEPPPAALAQWRPDAGNLSAPASLSVSRQLIALETQLIDPEAPDLSEQKFTASLESTVEEMQSSGVAEAPETAFAAETADAGSNAGSVPADAPEPALNEPEAPAWRGEISARLSRYRARRNIRPLRYPSLRLEFPPLEAPGIADSPNAGSPSPAFEPVSDHALALDGMMQRPSAAVPDERSQREPSGEAAPAAISAPSPPSGAKILEFPKSAWDPPLFPADQLAEPVSDRPRILEVPEVAPPPPALGGITIEAAESQETEKRRGIDIPLHDTSLVRRVLASVIDGLIVATASALFGLIFWKVAAIRPPRIQILGLSAGIPGLLWTAYQYLLIVYAASTPGLRLAGLELTRFDGTAANRSLRRWRVLASYLSGASLGMGFAWAFLDEDALCWHDRITRTYLGPRKPQPKPGGLAKT